jgi:error-prone DNA polymerase
MKLEIHHGDTLWQSTEKNMEVKTSVNCIGEKLFRDALWQVERAVRWSGPLLDELPEMDGESPLAAMTDEERLVADFRATGLTVGPHPMQYRRAEMKRMGIYSASDLAHLPNGRRLRIGGCVIARQRPGTAKGMMFMSLEDETGIANAIFAPDLLQKNRVLLISERFLMIEGILQNQDNVIHIRAEKVSPLRSGRQQRYAGRKRCRTIFIELPAAAAAVPRLRARPQPQRPVPTYKPSR